MRLDTNIESGDDLFTDLNGLQVGVKTCHLFIDYVLHELQMIRRKRQLSKLPLQAHFYPMSTSAYIEDSSMRLSLFGAQALGVASLKSGPFVHEDRIGLPEFGVYVQVNWK